MTGIVRTIQNRSSQGCQNNWMVKESRTPSCCVTGKGNDYLVITVLGEGERIAALQGPGNDHIIGQLESYLVQVFLASKYEGCHQQ